MFTRKGKVLLLSIIVFFLSGASVSFAENQNSLLQRFREKMLKSKETMERTRSYQKTQERILANQRLQNQRTISETTQKLHEQSRVQRAKLDELKKRMDDLKRRQSYYSRVQMNNPLANHSFNIRNRNNFR